MKTRQSINVTSQSLTYTGLIDFGDQEIEFECVQNRVKRQKMRKKSQEKEAEVSDGLPIEEMQADYGLVIMFQPLYDSYSQPIAVFASKGPVRGRVLAQLIIKSNFMCFLKQTIFHQSIFLIILINKNKLFYRHYSY